MYEIIPTNSDSENLVDADQLKYQKPVDINPSNDLLTVKLRYKKPDGIKSKLIEIPVAADYKAIKNVSPSFKFAAGVAGFGLLLRESKFKSNVNIKSVIQLTKDGLGNDPYGYRSEFISLVKKVKYM